MIAAAEININIAPEYILSIRPGIWAFPVKGEAQVVVNGALGEFPNMPDQDVAVINSVRVNFDDLIPVYSLAEVEATPNSFFFWDDYRGTKTVCINIGNREHYYGKTIQVGIIDGYISSDDAGNAYYNDVFYEPRLKNIPSISMKRDRLSSGIIQFPSNSITLINDGRFNGRNDLGTVVNVYAYRPGDEYRNWLKIFSGVVHAAEYNDTEYKLSLVDKRQYNNSDMICGVINAETAQTVIEADDETEQFYPVSYNQIIKLEAAPIHKDAEYVTFKFCAGKGDAKAGSLDTQNGIAHYPFRIDRVWRRTDDDDGTIVYKENEIETTYDTGSVVTSPITGLMIPNVTAGTFKIKTSSIVEDDSIITVFVDYIGWHRYSGPERYHGGKPLLNAAEICMDMLNQFSGIQYNSANIDLALYEIEKAKVEGNWREISYTTEYSKVKNMDAIAKVAFSADLIVPILADGRYAIRYAAGEASSVYEIKRYQYLKNPTFSHKRDDVVTSTALKYGYAGNSENQQTYKDESRKDEIANRWRIYKEYAKETCLADADSAKLKSDAVLELAAEPRLMTEYSIPLDIDNVGLDIVDALIGPSPAGRSVWDIISIDKNIAGESVKISCQERSPLEYDADYAQGAVYGNPVYGFDIFRVTTIIPEIEE